MWDFPCLLPLAFGFLSGVFTTDVDENLMFQKILAMSCTGRFGAVLALSLLLAISQMPLSWNLEQWKNGSHGTDSSAVPRTLRPFIDRAWTHCSPAVCWMMSAKQTIKRDKPDHLSGRGINRVTFCMVHNSLQTSFLKDFP